MEELKKLITVEYSTLSHEVTVIVDIDEMIITTDATLMQDFYVALKHTWRITDDLIDHEWPLDTNKWTYKFTKCFPFVGR